MTELRGEFDAVVWSETIYYLGDTTSVPEMYDLITTVADQLADGGVLCLANIVGQEDVPEAPLTRAPVIKAYQGMLESVLDQVHDVEYTGMKEGSEFTYRIWGFRAH